MEINKECGMPDCEVDPFSLHLVIMPLVRVMKSAHISWAQREECAFALQESIRQHDLLKSERDHRRTSSMNYKWL